MESERLSSTFKPIIFILYVSGLYCPLSRPCQYLSLFKTLFTLCSFLLGVITTGLFTAKSFMFILSFWHSKNIVWIVGQFWMLCNLLYVAMFFPISVSRNLPKFLASLDEYHKKNAARNKSNGFIKVVSWCLFALFYIVAVVMSVYEVFFEYDDILGFIGRNNGTSVDFIADDSVLGRTWLLVTYYYIFVHCLAPAALYSCLWLSLFSRAKQFNREFTDHLFDNSPDPCRDLEHFRLRHGFLCKLIKEANACMCHFLCTTYTIGLPFSLIALHNFLYGNLNPQLTYMMMLSMVYFSDQLVIVTLTGVALCTKMHYPAEILHRINVENMNEKFCQLITNFLLRLNGSSIGFSVYGLFTINTSTILMVSGTTLTYALVVIQFPETVSTANDVTESSTATPSPNTLLQALNGSFG